MASPNVSSSPAAQTTNSQYEVLKAACDRGLSVIRPLRETARATDTYGWNFGNCAIPSYQAYGRQRALLAVEEISKMLQPMRSPRVLEVAANDAALSAALLNRLGCEVVANDIRSEHLQAGLAAYHNGSDIHLLPGNLFDLDPRTVGPFDLVVACEVIEHVAHSVEFLSHLRKFLKPNGRIFLTTPNGSYFRNKLPTYSEISDFEALEARQFLPDADGHLFLITPDELRKIAADAGLVVESIDLSATPLITGHCGVRLLGSSWLWPWYQGEMLVRRLPWWVREKVCFSLQAVLAPHAGVVASQSGESQ